MRKFLLNICLFLLLTLVLDQVAGHCLQYVSDSIKIGGTGKDNYICNEVSDDILIFGSSRAENHYNTQLMTDSLNIPCYNCGESGCGILLSYGRLQMILERHKPKVVIYDLNPDFDMHLGADNHKYLYRLKPHYGKNGIDSIFYNVDEKESIKMLSGMYRFNSVFFQNLLVFLSGMATDDGIRGFRPIKEKFDPMKITEDGDKRYSNKVIDTLKMKYLEKFIDMLCETDLIFVVSPVWYGLDTTAFEPVKEICKRKSIIFVDFSNNSKYVHNDNYFVNGQHLNEKGADEFSKDIVKVLKQINIQ